MPIPPGLGVEVTGHHEVKGHTFYQIEGTVGEGFLRPWRAEKRLVELRTLHDEVERVLGRARYKNDFTGVNFASHGGLPGTTKKARRSPSRRSRVAMYRPRVRSCSP